MNRCTHCGLDLTDEDPLGPNHDTVDCARRVALAGRSDIVRALGRRFVEYGDTARAQERAEAAVLHWEQRTAAYLREYAAVEALVGKEGIRIAADLVAEQAQPPKEQP